MSAGASIQQRVEVCRAFESAARPDVRKKARIFCFENIFCDIVLMTWSRQSRWFVLGLLVWSTGSAVTAKAPPPVADTKADSVVEDADFIVRRYEVREDDAGRLVRVALRSRRIQRISGAERSAEPRKQVVQGRSSLSSEGGRLDIASLVGRSARRHNVDPKLIYAVIRQESDYNPFAVSHKGALGLMQLMPETARRFGVKDIFDPAENVDGGAKLLRHLLDRYDGDQVRALAAYNAGEAAVERYDGVPPYEETLDYVDRVSRSYAADKRSVTSNAAAADKGPRIVVRVEPSGEIRFETEPR